MCPTSPGATGGSASVWVPAPPVLAEIFVHARDSVFHLTRKPIILTIPPAVREQVDFLFRCSRWPFPAPLFSVRIRKSSMKIQIHRLNWAGAVLLTIFVAATALMGPSSIHAQSYGWRTPQPYPVPQQAPVAGKATGAAVGGVTGGLIGAAIGSNNDKTKEGALIGGIAGVVAGGLLGNRVDQERLHQAQYEQQSYNRAVGSAVSFEDIVHMSQSGLADEIIIRQVESQGILVRPTTSDLILLKNNGVSDRVLAAIQSAYGPNNSPPPPTYAPPQPRYVVPAPQPVIIEQWATPVYVTPVYRHPYPYHHRHGYSRGPGFQFNF